MAQTDLTEALLWDDDVCDQKSEMLAKALPDMSKVIDIDVWHQDYKSFTSRQIVNTYIHLLRVFLRNHANNLSDTSINSLPMIDNGFPFMNYKTTNPVAHVQHSNLFPNVLSTNPFGNGGVTNPICVPFYPVPFNPLAGPFPVVPPLMNSHFL